MNTPRRLIVTLTLLFQAALLSTAHATITVIGWGQDNSHQATNTTGALTGIQAIAAGSDDSIPSVGFSLGLNPNGTISYWGGISTAPISTNSYFVSVAAGEYHGLALSADGKVYSWGSNHNQFSQTNVPGVLNSNVIAVAAGSGTDAGNGGTHSLALKSDGTVTAWGKGTSGQLTVPTNLANVVAIAAGATHSLALKSDGTVVNWGGNLSLSNTPVAATNIVAIAAGNGISLALRTNGTVLAWGNVTAPTNVPAYVSNIVAIAAGDLHCMALRRDGTIVLWGNTNSGSYTISVPVGLTNVTAIASSGRHALAIVDDTGTPGITVPPRNQSTYPGGSATFVVMAAGANNLTYQWQANGINISRATNSILVLTNLQPANSGYYQVNVRSSGGVSSAGAGLTLLDGRVNLTQSLAATNSVDANSNLTLTVTAVGAIPLSFQWWKDGGLIVGATNSSYALTNAQTANAGGYSVLVSNVYGAVMSSTDNIGVVYYPPVLLLQPVGTNVPVGGSFSLKASATGTTPLSWQWYTNGTAIPGATTTNYTILAAQLSDAWSYTVTVTNSVGKTNSNPAVINVGYPPMIAFQPISLTANVGDTAAFSCIVTGAVPISLQWTFNGYPLVNQTDFNLTLANVQTTNVGFYSLVATNNFGRSVSSNAMLNLNGFDFAQWAGLIAYYPLDNGDIHDASGYGNDGTNYSTTMTSDRFGSTNSAMFFSTNNHAYIQCKTGAYFGTNFTVCAWVNETNYNLWSRVLDFANGPGIDDTFLAISDGTSGKLDLEAVTNTVRVDPDYVSSSVVPLNTWVHVAASWDGVKLNYYLNGSPNGSYAISLNRVTPVTTINFIGKSSYTNNTDQYYAGSFDDIRIFNRALSTNDIARLYTLEADVPVITQQPQAQTVTAGSQVSFGVNATDNHPVFYQWRKNDLPIPGASNSQLILTNVQPADIGFYSVTISNSVAGVSSLGVLLNLVGAPDPTLNGLIGYYPLNGNANDASSNGLNGVVHNGSWTTNRFGVDNSALSLNGSTTFISVNDPAAVLNFDIRTDSYSITTWVLLNAPLSTVDECFLIDRGTSLNLTSSYNLGYDHGANRFYIQMWDHNGTATQDYVQVDNASPVVSGRWYQLAVVVTNRVVNLFVNGVNESVPTLSGGIAPASFGTTKNTEGIRDFGRFAWINGFANYMNGNMDDIRFYNRALSADEVAYLYNLESTSTVKTPPTLAVSFGAGPSLGFNFTGAPGSNYVLQATTNLAPPIQWLPLFTNMADANGLWQGLDTNLNSAQKFYRVTTP